MKAKDLKAIEQWTEDLGGVFTMPDLKVLFGGQTEAALYKKLERFLAEGALIKVKRGLYARPTAALPTVAARICPHAYVSLGTVLAREAIVGSIPARRVQAVKVGAPRTYACALGTIEFLSIAPRLFLGFECIDGIRYATPEKAYLDSCYFAFRGKRLFFDLDSDVDRSRLDDKLLAEYLRLYDRRFVAFFKKVSDS